VPVIDEDGLFLLVAAAPAPEGMDTEEAAPEDSWDAVGGVMVCRWHYGEQEKGVELKVLAPVMASMLIVSAASLGLCACEAASAATFWACL